MVWRSLFLRVVGERRATVHVVPALGGTERRISPVEAVQVPSALDWSPDGRFLGLTLRADASGRGRIGLLSPATGELRALTSPSAFGLDRWPRISPDGRTIAFVRNQNYWGWHGDLYLVPVTGGSERRLTFDERAIRGHDWTPDGKELILSSNRGGQPTLWRISADGSDPAARPVAGVGGDAFQPTLSRKGQRLAYQEERQDAEIRRVPVQPGTDSSRLTLGVPVAVPGSTRIELSPQVSPDGRQLVFVSRRGGDQAIWVSDLDGSNALQVAVFPGYLSGSPRWSADGQRIAFDAQVFGRSDIFVVSAQGGTPIRLTSDGAADDVLPSWSQDGRWIYFGSDRSGRGRCGRYPPYGARPSR
jgi:Tol biopolymer transport system component